MSDLCTHKHRVILHVRSSNNRAVGDSFPTPETMKTHAALKWENCPDVYRGLARLGRDTASQILAIVVCVDPLTPSELEFFTLARKLCPDVNVYVYARPRAKQRIAEAIAHGAKSEWSDSVLRTLTSAIMPPDQSARQPSIAPAVKAVDFPAAPAGANSAPEQFESEESINHATPPVILVTDELQPDDNEDEEVTGIDTPPSEPVRVPWLRYSGRPTRIAPQPDDPDDRESLPRTPPADESPAPSPDTHPRKTADEPAERVALNQPTRKYEPLLTDEELRALLADGLTLPNLDAPTEEQRHGPQLGGGRA